MPCALDLPLDSTWTGVNVTLSSRPQAYVTVTPYTISYAPYDVAVDYSLPIPKLKKATGAVAKHPPTGRNSSGLFQGSIVIWQ